MRDPPRRAQDVSAANGGVAKDAETPTAGIAPRDYAHIFRETVASDAVLRRHLTPLRKPAPV
jgi:hypothetical protein